jgi:hypothetical protein
MTLEDAIPVVLHPFWRIAAGVLIVITGAMLVSLLIFARMIRPQDLNAMARENRDNLRLIRSMLFDIRKAMSIEIELALGNHEHKFHDQPRPSLESLERIVTQRLRGEGIPED